MKVTTTDRIIGVSLTILILIPFTATAWQFIRYENDHNAETAPCQNFHDTELKNVPARCVKELTQ